MAYEDRDRGRGTVRGDWQSGRDARGYGEGQRSPYSYDRGYGRDPDDRSPGSHVDYHVGGDRGQRRMGPGDGFEMREDYRRTDRYADQGKARAGRRDDDDRRFADEEGHGGYTGYADSGDRSEGMRVGGGRYGASTTNPDAIYGGVGIDPEFSGGPRFDRADVGSTGTHGVHPVASAFGEAQRDPMGLSGGGGSSARERAIVEQYQRRQHGQQRSRSDHDPHYSQWRQRQIEALDRDYDEYRREHASRFHEEFGAWREQRGRQRQSLGRVTEHMDVVGSDDQHVGTVDCVKGDRIILTKSDPSAGGHHHSVPCAWIDKVEEKVMLNRTSEQAMQAWRDEETSRALFERDHDGSGGPHILERSFSGTYRDE